MINGLITGWILSLFGFVGVVQVGMIELFGISISEGTYYFIFAVLGFIFELSRPKNSKED